METCPKSIWPVYYQILTNNGTMHVKSKPRLLHLASVVGLKRIDKKKKTSLFLLGRRFVKGKHAEFDFTNVYCRCAYICKLMYTNGTSDFFL